MSPTTPRHGQEPGANADDADDAADDEGFETDAERRHFEVGREHKGLSVLDLLDGECGPIDRSRVAAATHAGQILLNGQPIAAGATLKLGDLIELKLSPDELQRRSTASLPILHQDDELVVGDKPSGMSFAEGRHGGASAVGKLTKQVPGARPLHRLDKETSGVVVAARNAASEERLQAEFADGRAAVDYLALVRGTLEQQFGTIDIPLGKRRKSDTTLQPDPGHGTPCETSWKVRETLRGFVLLEVRPMLGGRSHQVRAHLSSAGMPVLCDRLYGEDDRLLLSQLKLDYRPKRGRPERPLLSRPALHAACFVRGSLQVRSPLPPDLDVLLAQLRRLRPLS